MKHETPSLRIDVREPGRRAGHSKVLQATVPAPSDIGTPIIGVPEGSEIDLDLVLQAVGEGILVTGSAVVQLLGECSRCLETIDYDDTFDLMVLFAFPPTDSRGRDIPRSDEDDDEGEDIQWVQEDHVDLEGPLRDAIVLELPLAPLCEPDCLGLCPDCGISLQADPTHTHEVLDERWQGLATLLSSVPSDQQDVPDLKED